MKAMRLNIARKEMLVGGNERRKVPIRNVNNNDDEKAILRKMTTSQKPKRQCQKWLTWKLKRALLNTKNSWDACRN